ncbi:MAG: sugar ABC transporter ATP-binding protein [Candidatus Limiplasma sp.]|nr:sugar ABC transporter ATP-binding protein [Candidatus Limiplasma sp.]
MSELLRMSNIRKVFPGMVALDNVSFDLGEGEVHALLGENGAGKSTLMNILFGLYRRDGGTISIRGHEENLGSPEASYRAGVRLIPQELHLIPTLTVQENIFAGHLPHSRLGIVDNAAIRKGAQEVLSQLGLTHIDLSCKAGELSVSQQQMVAIARAFQASPSIIVFDEPTSALSRDETAHLFDMIRHLKSQKVGIIYITHRLEEVLEIADRVTVMRDGKVAGHAQGSEITIPWIMDTTTGLSEDKRYPKVVHKPREEKLLEVEHLSLSGKFEDVNFNVKSGEILGLTGFVGAGKTELARVLFGIDAPSSGIIRLHGKKVEHYSISKAIAQGVALIPEDRRKDGLVTSRTILENLTLPMLSHYCNRLGVIRKRKEASETDDYIHKLNIVTTSRNKRVRYLSGGNQQKIVIAKWLNAGAKIFIFDEATRGIDVGAKAEIYRLMGELAASGAAVINISMEFQEILGVSDRILVMRQGRVAGELPIAEATADRLYQMAGGEKSEN